MDGLYDERPALVQRREQELFVIIKSADKASSEAGPASASASNAAEPLRWV